MGTKDVCQSNYLDDPVRFADQVNGALFGGRQVVMARELEETDPVAVYQRQEGSGRKNYRVMADKTYIWKEKLIRIITVENQNYVDYRMVLRNMLSESIGYHKQWRRLRAQHEQRGDLTGSTDEYLSGMKKDEKFFPIITLVVYFGTEHTWDGAKSLYELLYLDDEMKPYVSDYKLNLYDCMAHESFAEYRTGLRQVFETVRYGKDKKKLKKIMEESAEAYSSIDSATREMIEVMANVKITEEYGHTVHENGVEERRYDMCQAILDMIEDGRMEGKIQGMIDAITELLEDLGQIPQRVMELIQAQDDPEVLSRWLKAAARSSSMAEFEQKM